MKMEQGPKEKDQKLEDKWESAKAQNPLEMDEEEDVAEDSDGDSLTNPKSKNAKTL